MIFFIFIISHQLKYRNSHQFLLSRSDNSQIVLLMSITYTVMLIDKKGIFVAIEIEAISSNDSFFILIKFETLSTTELASLKKKVLNSGKEHDYNK